MPEPGMVDWPPGMGVMRPEMTRWSIWFSTAIEDTLPAITESGTGVNLAT